MRDGILNSTALHCTVQYSKALTIWPILFSYQSINNVSFPFLHLSMQKDQKEIKQASKQASVAFEVSERP